jgi:hypothetical protein
MRLLPKLQHNLLTFLFRQTLERIGIIIKCVFNPYNIIRYPLKLKSRQHLSATRTMCINISESARILLVFESCTVHKYDAPSLDKSTQARDSKGAEIVINPTLTTYLY